MVLTHVPILTATESHGGRHNAGPLGTPEGFGAVDLQPDGSFGFNYQTFSCRAG